LTTDKPSYKTGEPIALTLTVRNTTQSPIELHFATSQRYDFLIHDASSRSMWSWAGERMFLQVLGREEIAPGATRTFTEQFLRTLPAGRYRATGKLAAREETPPAFASFAVE